MYQIQPITYFFIQFQFKVVGRELSIALADHLLKAYKNPKKKTNRIRRLLDNIDLHILYSMNPDGFEKGTEGECGGTNGRKNANGVSKKEVVFFSQKKEESIFFF